TMQGRLVIPFLLFFSIFAHAENFSYTDARGVKWTRHVVEEKLDEGKTRVTVIDVPDSKKFRQKLSFRRTYSAQENFSLTTNKFDTINVTGSEFTTSDKESEISLNAIWPHDHMWTLADEDDYAKWLEANADGGFLHGSGVEADCADYALAMRWIYAHDHR